MLGTHRLWISSRLTAMKIGGRSDLPFSYLNLSKIILNRRQVGSIKERITILKTNFEFLIFFSSLQDNNHCTIQFSIINTHTLIGLAIAQIGQQNGQQIGRVYFSKMYFWEVCPSSKLCEFILVFSFFSFPCGGWRRSIHQCWPNICHQCLNDVCPPKESTAQKIFKIQNLWELRRFLDRHLSLSGWAAVFLYLFDKTIFSHSQKFFCCCYGTG